jgi:hypothetical protein
MAANHISRRAFVGGVGGAVLGAPVAAALAPGVAEASPRGAELLRPLCAGSRFGRWTLVRIGPLDRGAVTVRVRAADGAEFNLEILARDPSPLVSAPPASTARFAVYVCNGGDGTLATAEEQGLAAMALATVVAGNEPAAPADGFLTHAARLWTHPRGLVRAARSQGPTRRR